AAAGVSVEAGFAGVSGAAGGCFFAFFAAAAAAFCWVLACASARFRYSSSSFFVRLVGSGCAAAPEFSVEIPAESVLALCSPATGEDESRASLRWSITLVLFATPIPTSETPLAPPDAGAPGARPLLTSAGTHVANLAEKAGFLAVFEVVLHSLVRHRIGFRNGVLQYRQPRFRVGEMIARRVIADDLHERVRFLVFKPVTHLTECVRLLPERIVGGAVERILLGEVGVAAFGGRHGAAVVIKLCGAVFLVGQNLLHVAEFLFGGLREFGIRELSDHRAAFVFGALTFGIVTIRLHHLLHVDIANLRLRLGRLFHARVEQDEILVFDFGLGEPVR